MSLESILFDTIKGFVANRVYPDIAPPDVVALPRITYQAVGGVAYNYIEPAPVLTKNVRMQVNVWGATRLQVAALSRQIENALKSAPALFTTVLSAPVSSYESDTRLYGTRQDFSFFMQ